MIFEVMPLEAGCEPNGDPKKDAAVTDGFIFNPRKDPSVATPLGAMSKGSQLLCDRERRRARCFISNNNNNNKKHITKSPAS